VALEIASEAELATSGPRRARGAYQKGRPSQSRADQCFQRLQGLHSSLTPRVAGLSSRSSLRVVGNRRQRRSERRATAGQPGWENAAASWTHSSIRPSL
jgi:hypothetical protein